MNRSENLAQTPLEQEVARLIISTLNLENIDPGDIAPESPLFNDGLGLDSIDALEISLAISSSYGFQIRSEDSFLGIFLNLRSLSQHIEKHKTR
jgi:acyl carrier protein